MFRKLIVSALLPMMLLCACGTRKQKTEVVEVDTTKPIVISMAHDVPGYFIVGGESYGYPYELLNRYAEDRGREMVLHTGVSSANIYKSISSGYTDMAVSLSAKMRAKDKEVISLPIYSATYVVLSSNKNAQKYRDAGSVSEMLNGGIVMVSSGFESTKVYDELLDSIPTSALLYVSPRDAFDLAASLSESEFDLLICEKSEALLAEGLLHNVTRVYEFEEHVPVSLVFGKSDEWLRNDFGEWLDGYKQTKNYASLNRIYLEKGFASQFPAINKPNRVVGGISVWDEVVREVGEKEGVDWKLLSAIAYNESRFRPDVESHRGAKGMMQIMPIAARQFNMENSDLNDPMISLTIAAKLLKSLDNMLDFEEDTSDEDRLSIILAAYNGGIGHVMDARRLALLHDEDRNSWDSVAKYLVLMGDSDFEADITYRTFRGSRETLAYVDKVISKYDTYKAVVP